MISAYTVNGIEIWLCEWNEIENVECSIEKALMKCVMCNLLFYKYKYRYVYDLWIVLFPHLKVNKVL